MRDYMVFRARFGAAVKRRRKAREMTQADLGAAVGIDQASVARLERGKQGFDSDTLFQLGLALHCSLADLLAEVENLIPETMTSEAKAFARVWMTLPRDMREDYRRRIEALAIAMSQSVPDETVEGRKKLHREPVKHHS